MRDWHEYLKAQEIKVVAIDAITPYDKNPRLNDKAVPAVAKSIERFGFRNPILVDKDGVIVEGHTRRLAALSLGMQEVPVIYATDLAPDEVDALRVIDNKTAELADWDTDSLAEEIGRLMADFNFGEFGFTMSEIADMGLAGVDDDADSKGMDFELGDDGRPDVEVRTSRGDVWDLDGHRLMCGDSTSKEDVERLMDGILADCVITDPPYNVAIKGQNGMTIENDDMSDEAFDGFLEPIFQRVAESLKPGGACYVWHASRTQRAFENALNKAGLHVREQLIWVKDNFTLGRQDYQWRHEPCFYLWKDGAAHKWTSGRDQSTVLEFPKPKRSDLHPSMKPVALIRYQLENSTEYGDTVLDLFGGSGTTLIAAELSGRKCRMMELDPKYATVILDRWEAETGKKAVLRDGSTGASEDGEAT